MDAKTLGEAAGVQVGTLNAWIQRGYVRGIKPDARGRLRDFDLLRAAHIGIMADLTRYGIGAPAASVAAMMALAGSPEQNPFYLIFYAKGTEQPISVSHLGAQLSSMAELPEVLAKIKQRSPDQALPSAYILVNTGEVIEKMRKAEEKWQLDRKQVAQTS